MQECRTGGDKSALGQEFLTAWRLGAVCLDKFPRHYSACARQTKTQTAVAGEFVWRVWRAVFCPIVGACDHAHLHIGGDSLGNHIFGDITSQADAGVKPFGDDVHKAVVAHQFQLDFGILTHQPFKFVPQGADKGGTLPMKEIGSFNVLAEFVGKVDLPMMLAGGIADKKAVQTAFMVGAEGVWVGTAFIATHECRASQKVKDLIVQSTANDLLLFRTEPYYYRSLPTALAKKCFEMSENGATRADIAVVMNAGTGMRLGMLEGDFERVYVSVGNGISAIDRVKSVPELVDELMG